MLMQLLTMIFIIPISYGYTQQLPDFEIPKGYKIVMQTDGDLDRDGFNETVYICNTRKLHENTGYERVIYITKQINGKRKLWKENTTVLWNSKDCGFYAEEGVPLKLEIIRNTLSITQTFNHNSRHSSSFKSIFRYQQNNWFLIGSTHHDYDNCDFDFTYDINLSTGKIIIDKEYSSCDNDTPLQEGTHDVFIHSFPKPPLMDGFVPGRNTLTITETKEPVRY